MTEFAVGHRTADDRQPATIDASHTLATVDDRALLQAIDEGNRDALAEVYNRYGPSVYGLGVVLHGPAVAEELTHDVFLALWSAPKVFDLERRPLASHLLSAVGAIGGGAVQAENGHRSVGCGAMIALGDLPDAQREAIVLAYIGGFSLRRVAFFLGRPVETVRGHIRAGLTTLRAQLDQQARGIGWRNSTVPNPGRGAKLAPGGPT